MSKKFLLERETREVEVSGRTFRLTEMSGADMRRYIDLQLQPAEHAVQQLVEAGEAKLEEAVDRMTAAADPLYLFLLREPADGGAPADADLVAGLTFRQRRRLIALQDEINDMETLVGNAVSLLAQAQARRKADEIAASAGPS